MIVYLKTHLDLIKNKFEAIKSEKKNPAGKCSFKSLLNPPNLDKAVCPNSHLESQNHKREFNHRIKVQHQFPDFTSSYLMSSVIFSIY